MQVSKLMMCAMLAAAAVPPIQADSVFKESFQSADDFEKWTVIDVNEDNATWNFSEEGYAYYSFSSSNQADDWFISPEIDIPETGSYLVKYEYRGSSYGEAMDVYYGTGNTVDSMKTKAAGHPEILGDDEGSYFFADFKEGDKINLGFHAVSPANGYRLYLFSVEVETISNPVDLSVKEITSPKTGEALGQETVTVKVENKGTAAANGFDVCFRVDSTEAVTEHVNDTLAAGKEMEFTFKGKADLSTPRQLYTVTAWISHPDDFMPSNDTTSVSVRHVAPATIPYTLGFEPGEDVSGITYLNLNEDNGAWHVSYNEFFLWLSHTGDGFLGYNYSSVNDADDWAFLEPINLEASYYVLKFWYSATELYSERLRVCIGKEPKPEAMTTVLFDNDSVVNDHYLESINIFKIPEAGQYYIGFYAYSEKDHNWLVVDDISLNKVDSTSFDLDIRELTAPGTYLREANKKDVAVKVMNVGIVDASCQAAVYVDSARIATQDLTIKAQEVKDVTFEDALSALGEGTHNVRVEITCDKDTILANNVAKTQVTFVGTPVKLWDFEDGQVPADLTFKVEDDGTVNPEAGEEFNEEGWGIFKLLEEHYLLGTYELAGTSWIDGPFFADRWVVFPKVHVNSENAHFVWESHSYTLPEDYEVKISEDSDDPADFSTVFSISGDTNTPTTHGISLADYKDKDIYVAIRIVTITELGEALLLDNLGFYGDIDEVPTGTEAIRPSETEEGFTIGEDCIKANGKDVKGIEIFTMSGAKVLQTEKPVLSTAALKPGIYIVRVRTSERAYTGKFAK